jgi:hypothetical protein
MINHFADRFPLHPSVRFCRISEGIIREEDGPVVAKRVYEIYLRSRGICRMSHKLRSTLDEALRQAIEKGRIAYEKVFKYCPLVAVHNPCRPLQEGTQVVEPNDLSLFHSD